MINALRNHPEPADIDASTEKWAVVLRSCHPDEFRKGGNRVCMPLLGAALTGLFLVRKQVLA